MNSRYWFDPILDDTIEDEKKPSACENTSEVLDFLRRTKEMEQEDRIRDHLADVKKEYGKLGKPNGTQILGILMNLKGESLNDAVVGAAALGRALEGHDGVTLFALSIVIAYIAQFVSSKVVRSILFLCRLLFYKVGKRKTEVFSKGIGCSPKRVKRAFAEVKEDGLARPAGVGNAPGSGRPSVKTTFAAVMTAYLMAVTGLDEESLDRECSRRHIGAIQNASVADDEETVMDVATVSSVRAACDELKAIVADVSVRADKALETADKANSVTLERMRANLSSAMAQIDKVMDEIAWLENIGKEEGDTLDNGNESRSPEEQAVFEEAVLKAQILPRMLSPIISLLTERCKGILKAFEETGGKNSYQLVRAARKNAKPKSLANELALRWEEYRLTLQDIEVMTAARLSRIEKDSSHEASEDDKDGQDDKDGKDGTYDIRTVDISSLYEAALEQLDSVAKKLESAGDSKAKKVRNALECVNKLKELLSDEGFQTILASMDQDLRFIFVPMFYYLNIYCQRWEACWTNGSKSSRSASMAADSILSKMFMQGLSCFLDHLNLYVRQKEDAAANSPQEGEGPGKGAKDAPQADVRPDTVQESREKTREAVLQALDFIKVLMRDFELSLNTRKERKNNKESRIAEALKLLGDISQQLKKEMNRLEGQENLCASKTLLDIANKTIEFLDCRLVKWEKDEEGKRIIRYAHAERIAGFLLTKSVFAYTTKSWKVLDGIYDGTIKPNTEGRYIGVEETGVTGEWFVPGAMLSPEARCKLILKLWRDGKNPRKIETWINYIISDEYDRNYGDPSDRVKCCRITRAQLMTSFHCLTGMTCSDETLWTILTKDMGYTGRQCGKLDQVGKGSKHRDEQFRHIQKKRDEADPRCTLVISIDVKAFLLLGRLKHDNGRIMCRKDGRVYRVLDHDFALKLRQIYPHGTLLVDPSRLDESAVLHPVGAYCPQDGTGYVALVLGKDTAESVCNLISTVIDIKRKTMPNLDTVLIMADGGGSNMANGVAWQSELCKLADSKNVTLDVMHFAPGSSKHNPVEHRLFSEISRNWSGKPFIDIEHVLGYVNSTRNKSLTVQGWFDTRRYETNAEKKARGEKPMTRGQLDKKFGDRITHEYPDGEMYKWNYTVRPSSAQKATA